MLRIVTIEVHKVRATLTELLKTVRGVKNLVCSSKLPIAIAEALKPLEEKFFESSP